MRKKENAHDYRFFPEPDLPVFSPDAAFLKSVEDSMVELPLPRTRRFEKDHGLSEEQAALVCEEKAQADYFEASVALAEKQGLETKDAAGRIANLLLTDIKHILHRDGLSPTQLKLAPSPDGAFKLYPDRLASLVALMAKGVVSGKNGKQILALVLEEDKDPQVIVRERGWEILSDPAKIAEAVRTVEAAESNALAEAREASAEGNAKRIGTLSAYLVGKVLAATGGRADPKIAGQQIAALIAAR
jgi:aspartyl-tRNA(Asn)/glutamyl-tRNA(Gln) amidotransferase subunit B